MTSFSFPGLCHAVEQQSRSTMILISHAIHILINPCFIYRVQVKWVIVLITLTLNFFFFLSFRQDQKWARLDNKDNFPWVDQRLAADWLIDFGFLQSSLTVHQWQSISYGYTTGLCKHNCKFFRFCCMSFIWIFMENYVPLKQWSSHATSYGWWLAFS